MANAIDIVKLDRRSDALISRKAGVAIAKAVGSKDALILAGSLKNAVDLVQGYALRIEFQITKPKMPRTKTPLQL